MVKEGGILIKMKTVLLQEDIPASNKKCMQCPRIARKSPINKCQVDCGGAPCCSDGGNEHRRMAKETKHDDAHHIPNL